MVKKKKSNSDYFIGHSVSVALEHATDAWTERCLGIEVSWQERDLKDSGKRFL